MILHVKSIQPLLSLDTTILQLSIDNISKTDLQAIVDDFRACDYEFKRVKKKRSLSANGYAWLLFDEIAKKVGTTKEKVYRQAINDVGVFSEITFSSKEALIGFKKYWQSNGIGWLTRTMDDTTLLAFYGSSTYSKEDMSRLIEWAIDNCKNLGIPTMSDDELSDLIGRWKKE